MDLVVDASDFQPPRDLSVGDIKAAPVLSYDPEFAIDAWEFCEARDLDALPSLDAGEVWVRKPNVGEFESAPMPSGRIIDATVYVFDGAVKEALAQYGVVFIRLRGALVGALHASDFNHPAVGRHLYDILSRYERTLRALAMLCGLTEADLLATVGAKRRNYYECFRERNPQAPTFHIAYLDDLQTLVMKSTGINLAIETIRLLRNATMHSKEYVNQSDRSSPDFIYDFLTFEVLFEAVHVVLYELGRIGNRVLFLSGLRNVGLPR